MWAARDRALDRRVAFKVLHDAYLGAADQQRLAAEARAMAKLSHPNVVGVYDVGEREGRTYMTMELVAGVPLSRWLERARGWREVVAVFRDAGEGIAAAHEAGVIHRDIKPSNILVGDDGRIRVADFGIAHANEGQGSGDLAGSPAYMSPERLRGEPADARGDQFGFCASLYEALHGRRAYDGPTTESLRTTMEEGPPAPIRDAPRWLHEVVARGLAPDPEARFPSMRALLDALRGPRRRRGLIAAAATSLALGTGAVLAIALGGSAPEPCESSRLLAGVWDRAVEERLAARFTASGVSFATATWAETARVLDGHARQWVAMHEASCRATHVERTQSVDLLERRALCLDRRRAALLQTVSLLGDADADVVEKAPSIARGLPAIAECADPAYLVGLGGPGGDASARGALPAAQLSLFTGEFAEGRARTERVIVAARASGDRELLAEALLLRGQLEQALRDNAASADTLAQVIELAGEIGAPRIRLDAWLASSISLQALGRLPEAAALLDLVDAALKAAPDPRREGQSASARGTLLARQSQYDRAVPEFERALARYTEVYGPRSPALAGQLKNLAQALRRLDRHPEAERRLREAQALVEPLGPDHPETLFVRRALAVQLDTMGRAEDAVVEFRAILKARRARFGDEHLGVASSHDDLGISLGKLGRHEESLAEHRAGLAIREHHAAGTRELLDSRAHVAETLVSLRQYGEAEPLIRAVLADRQRMFGREHIDVAVGHRQLATTLVELGRFDEAVAELQAARAILTELFGPQHRDVARTDRDEAALERRRGRLARAIELAQRAVAGFGEARDIDAGLARWELAQALARRTPARARALAREAREILSSAQGTTATTAIQAIDAWTTAL